MDAAIEEGLTEVNLEWFGQIVKRNIMLFSGHSNRFCLAVLLLCLAGAQASAQSPTQGIPCSDSLLVPCPPGAQQQHQSDPSQSFPQDQPSQGNNNGQTSPQMQDGVNQLYLDRAGTDRSQPDTRPYPYPFAPESLTDLQRLAGSSIGELLPLFGRNFFEQAPSTFAPGDQIAVTPDYVLGPGDDVLLRFWGPETFNSQLTVDRSGSIYIPKVGAVHVAGLRFEELQKQISDEMSHTYRNFHLTVNLGRLRSIQIYVVGEARKPGAYTISSLSTVLNALFVSGGPNVQGSLRHIQVRRNGQTFPEFDLYDLVLRGDKTSDIRLQTGDTIFIPPVGPQVALGGSVRHPAIYELKDKSTLDDVLTLAGGFSATGAPTQISLERIDSNLQRHAATINLDATGRAMTLRDGDVLYANHISSAFEQSVTLRGNLANPARFAWHPGMRLSDIIPDRRSLLTPDYWRERNRLGVPVPLFEPIPRRSPYAPRNDQTDQGDHSLATSGRQSNNLNERDNPSPLTAGEELEETSSRRGVLPPAVPDITRQQDPNNPRASSATLSQSLQTTGESPARPRLRIQIPAPEIDWSYAVIERLDPLTLKSSLVPFNLGRLIQDKDPTQNLELQSGDVVTILSQNDVLVPLDEQTKYIRLEGEFVGAGTYSVGPGETLDDVVARAGGLSNKAYLYGSSFQRESARAFQQQRLDEYISSLSADMERAAAVRTASSSTGILDPNALAEQRSLINQLRQLRATGRIVLEFGPTASGVASLPRIPLENGDVFRVPTRPNTISVIGAVYGQNIFLYNAKRKLQDYVALAGNPTRIADRRHAFIIRADGSVYSRERAQGEFFNKFDVTQINPGDSIVIPEKPIRPSALRNLIDYSQILSSFGLAAAAINVVR